MLPVERCRRWVLSGATVDRALLLFPVVPVLALFVALPAAAQTFITFYGGSGSGCDIYYLGCGVVFKLDTS